MSLGIPYLKLLNFYNTLFDKMSFITIDDIINSKNLNLLFNNLIKSDYILKKIRNFEFLDYKDVMPFASDKKILLELEKYGRYSILKKLKNK